MQLFDVFFSTSGFVQDDADVETIRPMVLPSDGRSSQLLCGSGLMLHIEPKTPRLAFRYVYLLQDRKSRINNLLCE